MRSMSSIYLVLALILAAGTVALFRPSPPSHLSMELVDRYDSVTPDGQRSVLNLVEVDGTDSLLFREYATRMYHDLVPDSVSATMPVQVITYFYRPENLRELEPMRLLQMSGGDKNRFQLFRKLGSDTAGFFAVRFSDIYRLMQRDSLYMLAGEVVVPRYGLQLKDFFSPPPSRD
ncbi:MAG: hypothetical protein ACKO9V_03085 [Candidatus Kapaibacterium sp.]